MMKNIQSICLEGRFIFERKRKKERKKEKKERKERKKI